MSAPFAQSRAAYAPAREELALDLGLATMFATGDGDLLGRGWRAQLEKHDRRIAGLARALQRQGIRPTGRGATGRGCGPSGGSSEPKSAGRCIGWWR